MIMKYKIFDVKAEMLKPDIYLLLSPSVYKPTQECLIERAKKYQGNDQVRVYAYSQDGIYKGIVVFEMKNKIAEILDIAVKPEYQGKGIGSGLIDYIFSQFVVYKITAETDCDAIGFYKKCGFTVTDTKLHHDTKRHICECQSTTHYYDLLIEENNDPVHDSKLLRDYMDKWDGQAFIDSMELIKGKSVLEVGVGTGRLAVRTASLCGELCGIDISPKTVERAKENLADYGNVTLLCGDFLTYPFDRKFDVVYSSLTFMHIDDKQKAVNKIAELLNNAGRFVLSIDKNQSEFIDIGTSKIKIYPDTPDEMAGYIKASGLSIINLYDTEFATIFVAQKDR